MTSLVRFLPGASFPSHAHPQGEEIFVLEGEFRDQRGTHTQSTLLLNAEGFRHAPSSAGGNLLFVRLRQYPNLPGRRSSRAVQSASLPWVEQSAEGVARKVLLDERPAFPEVQWLERWAPSAPVPPRLVLGGLEMLVLHGGFRDAEGEYRQYDWLRLPEGGAFSPVPGSEGCTLLLKSGGLEYAIPRE